MSESMSNDTGPMGRKKRVKIERFNRDSTARRLETFLTENGIEQVLKFDDDGTHDDIAGRHLVAWVEEA